jgi:O-antigen/teichoic acid export membrane protein
VTAHGKLARQVGVLGSGALLGLAIRFVQSALVARLLGVEQFGKLAVVFAFVAIISRVNDLGLPNAVAYYFRRAPGSLPALLRTIGFNFVWCCVVGLAVAFAAVHLPVPFAADLRDSVWPKLGLAAFIAISTPTAILPSLITAAGDYGSYVRLTNIDAALQVVFVLGACLLLGPHYQHAVLGLGVEQCLIALVYVGYLRRYLGRSPEVRIGAREAYSYGLRLQWGVLMKLISSRADLLIVGALMSSSSVGLYSVALGIRDIGLLPQTAYAAPFQNMVIDRGKLGAGSDRTLVLTSLLLQVALSVTMVVAAALALPRLIPAIYGSDFAGASGPAALLFSSIVFLGPASLCWMTYNAKGKPQLTSLVLTAAGILGPTLTYVMVTAGYGLYGASAASLATAAVTFALSFFFLVRLQRYRRKDFGEARRRALDLVRHLTRAALARARRARRST